MKRRLRTLSVTAALGALAASTLAVSPSAGASGGSSDTLAAVRAATAKYHRVAVALADGYHPTEECAESPDGVMGRHYVNPQLLMSPLDPERPAILLYVPHENGLRLAGVEWFQADADQDLGTDGDRPSLLGRPFDGPMPGHEAGMPVHYDLHAWVWAHNPAGVFAPWNAAVSC